MWCRKIICRDVTALKFQKSDSIYLCVGFKPGERSKQCLTQKGSKSFVIFYFVDFNFTWGYEWISKTFINLLSNLREIVEFSLDDPWWCTLHKIPRPHGHGKQKSAYHFYGKLRWQMCVYLSLEWCYTSNRRLTHWIFRRNVDECAVDVHVSYLVFDVYVCVEYPVIKNARERDWVICLKVTA